MSKNHPLNFTPARKQAGLILVYKVFIVNTFDFCVYLLKCPLFAIRAHPWLKIRTFLIPNRKSPVINSLVQRAPPNPALEPTPLTLLVSGCASLRRGSAFGR